MDWIGGLLAAIGIRETGFVNKTESDGAGVGVGIFQITIKTDAGSAPTPADAANLTCAANWAAETLVSNLQYIAGRVPEVIGDYTGLWMMAASWNTGAQGQVNRALAGQTPD